MDTPRGTVSRACELLISPTPANLDLCTALLESAAAGVAGLDSRTEALLVLEAIHHAKALLESAGEFHRQWERTLNVLCAGYEAGGEAAAMTRRGTVSLAG